MATPEKRFPAPPMPRPTGRHLVHFKSRTDFQTASQHVQRATGTQMVNSRELAGAPGATTEAVAQGRAVFIERFQVAVIAGDVAGAQMTALEATDSVRRVRPEFYLFAIDELERQRLEWMRAGLKLFIDSGFSGASATATAAAGAFPSLPFVDTDEVTWGLTAVGASRSAFTGRGVKVAVLDTGIDLRHPDNVGRNFTTRSFVPGEDVQDVKGHGTHTAGTIAGPKVSKIGRRYGIAPDVDLFVGKVLNNGGSGREGDIIDGINWAIDQKCAVISMSLGRPVGEGEPPDTFYEEVGSAALREGSLIVAAAGNDSSRTSGSIAPVGAPANSPSILAVAAVNSLMKVANFSCGGINAEGGEVNISGPGVAVYSSFPVPERSKVLQGTSMACPHVAGVAALWAQSDAALRGRALWTKLERSAVELGTLRDFGRGLVQAPDATMTS